MLNIQFIKEREDRKDKELREWMERQDAINRRWRIIGLSVVILAGAAISIISVLII